MLRCSANVWMLRGRGNYLESIGCIALLKTGLTYIRPARRTVKRVSSLNIQPSWSR